MNVLERLRKFARKSYRDGYLQTHVRSGIAYQIQALREKSGLTQAAFARATGKKQSTVSRLENTEYGRVSVQTLLDIACARNVALLVQFVSYPEFLERTKDMSPQALQPETITESIKRLSAPPAFRFFLAQPGQPQRSLEELFGIRVPERPSVPRHVGLSFSMYRDLQRGPRDAGLANTAQSLH